MRRQGRPDRFRKASSRRLLRQMRIPLSTGFLIDENELRVRQKLHLFQKYVPDALELWTRPPSVRPLNRLRDALGLGVLVDYLATPPHPTCRRC
jgi:hypothetical protein